MAGSHWLVPAAGSWTPPVIVSFDTETLPIVRDGREILTLRCWDARTRVRWPVTGGASYDVDSSGEKAGELADTLAGAVAIAGEAWCFAHNAGFDLTVTSLPMILAARGWSPVFVNLGDETCVFVLQGEAGKLVITDTWSWLRCGLATAAGDVGMRKTRLPEDDDTLSAWHHRCRHDVAILDRLLGQLLDWWDGEELGRFAVTGASCGWRSMRSQIPERAILVGTEQPRTTLEREAIYGGRKEVYRVGRIRGRNIEDWDLTAAHLTTIAHRPMPVVPLRASGFSPPLSPLAPPSGVGAIVRVEIITDTPCAPCRALDEVWWPVGRFRTTLTTPELLEVQKIATSIEVVGAQFYRLGDELQDWGRWCLSLQSQPDEHVPRVVKRVAKGWGRAVPGRFALRTSQLISERPATHLGWKLETGHDLDTGAELEIITYGGIERTYRRDVDGADVAPAILAFVEGYVRAAMARTLQARDPGQLLQVNTDGWWEIRAGRGTGDAASAVLEPYRAVRKATSRDVMVYGPNHLNSAGDRRLAGIPKDAAQQLDGSFAWQDWPGLRWQLQHSRPGEYARPGREVMLQDHYCRRWVLTSGETVPVSMRLDRRRQNEILPWSRTACRRPSDVLADWQVPALHALRDVDAGKYRAAPASLAPLPGRR